MEIMLTSQKDAFDIACRVLFDPSTIYRGFDVRWTGLKAHIDSWGYIGQWVGYPLPETQPQGLTRDQGIYVNLPVGGSGIYTRGELFEITSARFQPEDLDTSDARLRTLNTILEGRTRLLCLIDHVLDNPASKE